MDNNIITVICPYCSKQAELVDSEEIYGPGRNYGKFYLCRDCDAYVGCHKKGNKPYGRLANAELRKLRYDVHVCFDVIWKANLASSGIKSKSYHRNRAYQWLSEQMEIKRYKCHIGMFDIPQCHKAIEVCKDK